MKPLLEHEQLGPLGLHEPRHRDAGPGAHDLRDLLGAHLAAQEPLAARLGCVFALFFGALLLEPLLQLLPLHVELVEPLIHLLADGLARGLPILDLHAGLVEGELHLVELLPQFLRAADAALLRFPLLPQVGELPAELGRFLLDLGEPLLRVLLRLLGELPGRELELHEPPLHLVDLARHALQFHRDPARRLVHEVDRLVGEEAVGDVAVRELGRGHERRILDLHPLVVRLIAGLEPPQDRDRVFHARLADKHRLKPPLERRILFDVLAVFVERGRADAPQFAAGERRLQEVRRVGATFGRPRADHRVQLVDEEDHVAGCRLHLAEDRLEPVFEFTAILRAGDERAQVERHHAAAAQVFRHVRLHDPQRQALGDRRLADARFADEHGIVFRAPREHLDHAADLGIAADHRIELALARPLHEVDAVFLEGLKLLLGILVGHPRAAADRLQPRHQLLLTDGRQLQHVLRLRRHLHKRQEEMVSRDKLVLHRVGLDRGRLEDLDELLIGLRLRAAAHLRQVGKLRLHDPLEVAAIDADLLEERPHDPLPLRDERVEQVHRGHLRIAAAARELHRPLHRLLGLDRELVETEWHGTSP